MCDVMLTNNRRITPGKSSRLSLHPLVLECSRGHVQYNWTELLVFEQRLSNINVMESNRRQWNYVTFDLSVQTAELSWEALCDAGVSPSVGQWSDSNPARRVYRQLLAADTLWSFTRPQISRSTHAAHQRPPHSSGAKRSKKRNVIWGREQHDSCGDFALTRRSWCRSVTQEWTHPPGANGQAEAGRVRKDMLGRFD